MIIVAEEEGLTTMFASMESREDHPTHNPGHDLYSIMTTASTPVTPAPSTPTATRTHPSAEPRMDYSASPSKIVRPKSTPFPKQDLLEGEIQCPRRTNELPNMASSDPPTQMLPPNSPLHDLPSEIHECILDHLFGVRSAASRISVPGKSRLLRGWGSALRHSRRKEVTMLALVCGEWRRLIQDRLYRHLKIKGTRDSVEQAMRWFAEHPHLRSYVKHIEIWFPVFQQKPTITDQMRRLPSATSDWTSIAMPMHIGTTLSAPAKSRYTSASNNCSLEDAFGFVKWTFPEACVLTLEGGERKKPPKCRYFANPDGHLVFLPIIHSIRTLVIKGQWNLIREQIDFIQIAAALPNLNEWHSSYAKPKSKAYLSMATILPNFPANLTHVNIFLEGDFKREAVSPLHSRKVSQQTNFCVEMAKAMPALEHLAYTGRVCGAFFDVAARLSDPRTSRLKSVELIVKNVCRPTFLWNDGTGIMDLKFIHSFECLVLSGVRALKKLTALDYLRIRFIDLDSAIPHLNPYFTLANNKCTGIWSQSIVNELSKSRPMASFVEQAPDLAEVGYANGMVNGEKWPKNRPLSIKVSSYKALNGTVTIE